MAVDERIAHIERARLLAARESKRGALAKTRPAGVGVLRSGISRAVDQVALRVMQRVFTSAHRNTVRGAGGRMQSLADDWQRLPADEALATYFARPGAPQQVSRTPKQRLDDGVVEHLRFPSYYAPERATALEMQRRYPENATCHALAYRHSAREGRPAVVCLHGWGGGNFTFDSQLFRARWLYDLGLDVYLYVHPYHGPRSPSSVRLGAALHPSTNVTRANEAFIQTAWEVRSLIAHHQRDGGGAAGVMGMSLGGYGTAVVASVADELAFAVPIMPFADLPAFLWGWGDGTPERARAEKAGVTFDEFCAAMALHSPLAHTLKVPREHALIIAGRGDQIVPPAHAEALHKHWGEPAMHWFPGGHLVHFGRGSYLRRVAAFLGDIDVLPRTSAKPPAR
ncbi:MAG: alpha/beta hydrolase family protein [Myxococcales bacterium]|nr:alpha/beta hydrolase family protein [Myxococcales bacterium]